MPKDSRIEAFERDDIEARMRERIRSVIEALADEETGCQLVRRLAEGVRTGVGASEEETSLAPEMK